MPKMILQTLLFAIVTLGCCCRELSEEESLVNILFTLYNPSARPVLDSSHTVQVHIGFSLLQIQELDLRSQVFTTTGLVVMEWKDERLVWSNDTFSLPEIVVEGRDIWRPEFASINGADGIYGDYGQFRALIHSDGVVNWEPGGVFKTICEIDITYYPFDSQECRLIFGAWSYHTTKMNLTNQGDSVNLDSYENNGEWEITKTYVERKEFAFKCCPDERFSNVAFVIRMRRRYTFYVMNVILPSIMTSILLLSIFFCTPAQKVQIGVVVLLSFRIFLLNVTDSIPKTSDHIPLLGIYLTSTMAITTVSMVLTVLVLNLYHVTDRPVPDWTRRVVLGYVATVLCMSRPSTKRHRYAKKVEDNISTLGLREALGTQISLLTSINGTTSQSKYGKDQANGGPIGHKKGRVSDAGLREQLALSYKKDYSFSNSESHSGASQEVVREILEAEYSSDWCYVAEVVDRLFFWLFFVAITVTTLLLFQPLTKAYWEEDNM